MQVSIAESHNRLSKLLKEVDNGPITITKRGQPVGVLISPQEYEQVQRVQAYLQLVNLSKVLQESGETAVNLATASREELDGRA
ncbi:MAG: type II toxin-antitoxin system Phd/YefM family antitoxin [Chloroflexi bacterium]|nr:type II toxin-antitoxin system Phd/YefM family antitoxin [Chloroflexota bacterium]